jgi:hypothetical protein
LSDANGVGDYIHGLEPDFRVSEWEEGYIMQDAYYIEDDGAGNEIKVNVKCPLLSEWIGGLTELGDPSEPLLAEAIAQITGISRVKKSKPEIKSGRTAVRVPKIRYKEHLQRIIIDQDKFSSLGKK